MHVSFENSGASERLIRIYPKSLPAFYHPNGTGKRRYVMLYQ
jgi:hypothetical protein